MNWKLIAKWHPILGPDVFVSYLEEGDITEFRYSVVDLKNSKISRRLVDWIKCVVELYEHTDPDEIKLLFNLRSFRDELTNWLFRQEEYRRYLGGVI